MGTAASAATTPRSLKAVEQPQKMVKEQPKDTKETEGTEVGQLASHLQDLLLSGNLQLPDHLQQTVRQLQEVDQPRQSSMFTLENQRRKWQKKLASHQEKLTTSREAWQKFLNEVTRHLANKEEQYKSITQQAMIDIQEAQDKLAEIAQAMKQQIPNEIESTPMPSQEDPRTTEAALTLKTNLDHLQRDAQAASPPPQSETAKPPPHKDVMEIGSENEEAVSVQDSEEDQGEWKVQRNHRSRSRQEPQERPVRESRPRRNNNTNRPAKTHVGKKK